MFDIKRIHHIIISYEHWDHTGELWRILENNNEAKVYICGKGGTGKTFILTRITRIHERTGENVCYLDCDVEEPNG